ncbi:MAG TPA: hypothetical protein VM621_05060 [Luteibacter sp.]|uniref:hypothetical protein n=1 Tax=Luteibacter sp. TaxID=1886636 RepID=UPI002C63D3DC|nr:hypothetical protein [Luteibacter sp.]HVI54407.1 hypothetical protein [Luteibacter sp.]
MASKSASRNPLRSYVTVFEHEGRQWAGSCKSEALYDAELHASNEPRSRGVCAISTIPFDPEA